MSSPRQYGLLPCKLQGGVNHETTGKRPYLVRINRVLHVVDIHTPDPESPVRSPAEGRIQGSYLGRSVAGKGAGHADGDHAAPDGTGAVR